ncbi:serine hydrolase domain-containing protein [Nonomuraea sp. SYSU D8015]|uniref:serine hydrolase domain-containing protein n=1 Tax=Nonomuraea sp. SYSU D8015 TaxID=2593644 RepID=UPI001660C20D|nr:serine hydrolase domain-containing protein [Nonomuraea sp. SYSU D8015]
MRILIVLALVAGLSAAPEPSASAPLEAITREGAPAAVMAVREDGRVERAAAGVADRRTGRPAKASDRYRVASITKTFTAVVVLQLVAERRVALEDPIGRWLPGVPNGGAITVRDLLRHTSGLPDFYAALGLRTSQDWQRHRLDRLPDERRLALAFAQPGGPPGAGRATYSNTNYVVLGKLIERVTGETYEQQVARRLIRPLGLSGTSYGDGRARVRGPHLRGYMPGDLPGRPDADYDRLVDFTEQTINQSGAAGSMVSTVSDLTALYRALFTGRLLPATLMREMTASVPAADMPMPWVKGIGLGVHRYDLGCGPVYGHVGGVRGYTGMVVSTPDGRRQAAIAVTLNPNPATVVPAAITALTAAVCGDR